MTPLRVLVYFLLLFVALIGAQFLAGVYEGLGLVDKANPGSVMFGFFAVAFWHAFPRKPKCP